MGSAYGHAATDGPPDPSLTRYAWLSVGAAVLTISLKYGAYLLTGSVGLLSDAAESVVNLVAAVVAVVALRVAARPPDADHHYGHGKAEYFSAAIEGVMILVAAGFIIWSAIDRLIHPQPLEQLGIGLLVVVVATAVNAAVGVLLIRVGRQHRSATLDADGRHLMTDVWTSCGVVVGVLLVGITGWLPLDSLVAIAVALNILLTGWRLVGSSTSSLLDAAMDEEDTAVLMGVLQSFRDHEVTFHGLQTRVSGRHRFASVHLLVPGEWSVQRAHDVAHEVETAACAAVPGLEMLTHVEPREDARAYDDHRYDGGTWA